ncbi:hypothetical protein Taro_025198 [Colocasia esculenta]|uniref:Uncharacterized protein n=1 Tax=Colocasia esculenta TaxID=4460 RepID=A0A843V9K0_COLES|nr:hypothetical protein [Colocasia esculenta]
MKNLYPKGKGKIHPSPSCPGGPPSGDALAVLNLLPTAILALTAALGTEDREVLAYLVTRSLQGPWSVVAEERRRCRRQSRHQPLFDCGCFDCYTSYWYRWDSSPDRELIHQAIEAFEEHLASSEQRRSGGKGSRRRDRRIGDRADKAKRQADERGNSKRRPMKEEEEDKASTVSGARVGDEEAPSGEASSLLGEESAEVTAYAEEVVPEAGLGSDEESSKELDGGAGIEMAALPLQQGGERRRAWQDVMGLFGSRLWGLWGPAA